MQDAFAGAWAREPHLSDSTLGSLYELNHRFLDLCAAPTDRWPTEGRIRVPEDVPGQVAPLSAAQRAAAAHCPYALFDLEFDDDEHWRTRLGSAAKWRIADAAAGEAGDFVRLALFFAWHLASRADSAARLLLGMHEQTAVAFRSVTISCLPALAASEACNLTARWCDSSGYWSALVRAAAHADAERLRRVQLFGLQLAAAQRLP